MCENHSYLNPPFFKIQTIFPLCSLTFFMLPSIKRLGPLKEPFLSFFCKLQVSISEYQWVQAADALPRHAVCTSVTQCDLTRRILECEGNLTGDLLTPWHGEESSATLQVSHLPLPADKNIWSISERQFVDLTHFRFHMQAYLPYI